MSVHEISESLNLQGLLASDMGSVRQGGLTLLSADSIISPCPSLGFAAWSVGLASLPPSR